MLNRRDIFDLERACRGNVPPGVFKALMSFNEDIHAMRQQIMQLATMFDQLVNNQIAIANATKTLTDQSSIAKKLKQMGMEVGSDPSITGEVDEP